AAANRKEAERNIVQAIDHTAARLGNTRTVCRKYYIHPALIAAYLDGNVLPPSPKRSKPLARKPGPKLRKHEEQVLAFLRAQTQPKVEPPDDQGDDQGDEP